MESISPLRIATAALFVGWGLLHLFWDIPYRMFFWDEALLQWPVETFFRVSWNDYVTSSEVNHAIDYFIKAIGVLLLAFAAIVLFVPRKFERVGGSVLVGSAIIAIVAFLNYMESGFQLPMLLEFSAQVSMPIFAYLVLFREDYDLNLLNWMKLAVALTFTCHGLYALGIYPVPGPFIDMTINVLGVNESQAREFLKVVGCLDLLLSVSIFIPALRTPALAYAVVWGTLTTAARPLANIDATSDFDSVFYWLAQALYRFPHPALPLLVLILQKSLVPRAALSAQPFEKKAELL
jgi:hypothetical protein